MECFFKVAYKMPLDDIVKVKVFLLAMKFCKVQHCFSHLFTLPVHLNFIFSSLSPGPSPGCMLLTLLLLTELPASFHHQVSPRVSTLTIMLALSKNDLSFMH